MNAYANLKPHRGAAITPGHAYHDIPGVDGNVHRQGSAIRAAQIAEHVDLDGKYVLDIGCSVGGVAIALAQYGAFVVGVDWDESAVKFGSDLAEQMGEPVDLICADLAEPETWEMLDDIGPFDVVVWLANWMWIATAAGVDFATDRLRDIAESGATLVFETAEAGGSTAGNHGINTPADVMNLLTDAGFETVQQLGKAPDGWHGRSVFTATTKGG